MPNAQATGGHSWCARAHSESDAEITIFERTLRKDAWCEATARAIARATSTVYSPSGSERHIGEREPPDRAARRATTGKRHRLPGRRA